MMSIFRYTALNAAGAVVSGRLDGASRAAVVEHLQGLGYYPITTEDDKAFGLRGWLERELRRGRKPSQRELAKATLELASLVRAGVPLDRAIEMIAGFAELHRLREPLRRVVAKIRGGASFADAMAACGEAFPRVYINVVRAGEISGTLEATLFRLADYLGKNFALRETVRSAMIYPAIILITAGLSIGTILVYVMPEFEPVFTSSGRPVPEFTAAVIALGRFIRTFWWAATIFSIGGIVLLRRALHVDRVRLWWDRMLLRVPLLGLLRTKIEMERFSRTLGVLLSNGLPLPAALDLTKDTIGSRVIADAVAAVAVRLREGERLSDRLAQSRVFGRLPIDLLRVGEESGRLEPMLEHQADLCERDVKQTLDRLLATLVPAVTLFLGFIVAGVIASMLVAIFSMYDVALQ